MHFSTKVQSVQYTHSLLFNLILVLDMTKSSMGRRFYKYNNDDKYNITNAFEN